MIKVSFSALLVCSLVISCRENTRETIIPNISESSLRKHVAVLSSDEFQGRKPFTEGEEKTTAYLESRFKEYRLEPGNKGYYFQQVPLVELTARPSEKMIVKNDREQIELALYDEFIIYNEKVKAATFLEGSDLVFAGYGIVAPEYDWNDYEGLDVEGKTVIVLVNDPGFASDDSTFFKGETMTYYGRWTYKYEEAARQGAAGCLIVHETVPAGYPWLVVRNSWSGASLFLDQSGDDFQPDILGWLTRDAAIKLFKASGKSISNFSAQAKDQDFKAIPLDLQISAGVENGIVKDVSKNVIAMLEGSKRPDEVIIYSAHWDHLGIGNPIDGDSIYNGAHDNASGIATLLGIAEAMANGPQPERSIVFMAVTAEEQGLLGSKHYAAYPIFPPEKTVANINMDGITTFGKMRDVTVVGYGQSELEDIVEKLAKKQDRYINPDPDPGKGYFFRSDHFQFAKIGIPAFYGSGSYDHMTKGEAYVDSLNQIYLTEKYHRPQDEYLESSWTFDGMALDGELLMQLGYALANSEDWPEWKQGSEFKSIREASRK